MEQAGGSNYIRLQATHTGEARAGVPFSPLSQKAWNESNSNHDSGLYHWVANLEPIIENLISAYNAGVWRSSTSDSW